MHSDLGALDVVCRHYMTEYSSDALRRARNRIRRLMHEITRITIELYYVKALLKFWMAHALNVRSTITNEYINAYHRRGLPRVKLPI